MWAVGVVVTLGSRHHHQFQQSHLPLLLAVLAIGTLGNRHWWQCQQYRQLALSALLAVNTISSIGTVSIRQCYAATVDGIGNVGICRQGSASEVSAMSAVYISGLYGFSYETGLTEFIFFPSKDREGEEDSLSRGSSLFLLNIRSKIFYSIRF